MIYCLFGFAGAGKDSIAKEVISQDTSRSTERISFADAAKKVLCKILDTKFETFDFIKDTEYKNKKTYRQCLIDLAQGMKEIDENIWVKSAIKNLKKDKNYILTDLRFLHEFDFLKKNFKDIKFIKILGGKRYNEDEFDNDLFDLVLDNSNKKEENLRIFAEKIREL